MSTMRRILLAWGVLAFAFSSVLNAQVRISQVGSGDAKRVKAIRAVSLNSVLETFGDLAWNQIWLPAIDDLEPRMMRVQWSWPRIEATEDVYSQTNYDKLVRRFQARNITIVAHLDETPDWACGGSCGHIEDPPNDAADFGEFCGDMAAYYKPGGTLATAEGWGSTYGISYWQVRNEVNDIDFTWTGAEYVASLTACYNAIKAEDPTAQVIATGFNSNGDVPNPATFLNSIYENGGKPYFDIAAAQPYDTTSCSATETDGILRGANQIIPMRKVMCRWGDCSKPLWVTEYGKSSGGQAGLILCYTDTAYYHEWDQFIWFTLKDVGNDEFGLLTDCAVGTGDGRWTEYEGDGGCRSGAPNTGIYDTFKLRIRG